ncbi:serine/threonine-protein phosphatase 6 regulatory ankyrin repeat subunit B-like [Temnothorax curvispinosus]|uniref:Serine/threonine-protein phosphatase 6 regulatory ankyrin repeat subunit B-like n=1 Tax=Temnothorax curvispinosus TaxID=300111 RepID=A0A6J1Q118_9HYME|nr:serine/threonine-protein phosphatase 6 regulatory ankyrin repeat subunit B-like [Temnothorax curvispinosus]
MTIKTKPNSLKEIPKLFTEIYHSIEPRIQRNNLDKLIYEISFYIFEFEISGIKWIKKFWEKLNKKVSFTSIPGKTYNITKDEYSNQLELKLSELENILTKNALNDQFIKKLPFYKSNKKLQAVVEMLVLDIMSILDSLKHNLIKQNNVLFLDANTPLLIGKCLRNHLAHDNALVNVLLFDPLIAVVLNAKKLIEENNKSKEQIDEKDIKSKKKVGELISDNSFNLTEKYSQDLDTITNQERMFAALEEGKPNNFKDCLEKGADINARSINSWTTLHFAAKGSSPKVIKLILDQSLSVNVKDINGQSPLHIAAEHGRNNIVEFFIKEGLYINDLDNSGKTPLHVAAQNGHEKTVVVLLNNKKAHTIARDKIGLSLLHYAIINNHIGVTKILLEKTENAYKMLNEMIGNLTPLHAAAQRGYLELVNFLLQNNADVNVINVDWTPLHLAASNGHLEIVNILLKHKANVNAVDKTRNNTPLHYAAKYGHEEIVKTLLKNNAIASIATATGVTPLHIAAQKGYLGIVVALLDHDVDIHDKVDICAKDQDNITPLYCAAKSGHKKISELLIERGAEINAKTNNNLTPLHTAAMNGQINIVNLLIKSKKTEVDAITDDGSTPLHLAAFIGHIDIVKSLIESKKAKVDAITVHDNTPLHLAACNGHKDIVDLLITKGAKVNAITNDGNTPLHIAAAKGHKDIVDFLIKNQANVNATAKDYDTPLHIAVKAGHKEIVEILVTKGADVNVKSDNITPLVSAIKYNQKEIVKVLISNEVEVNEEGLALLLAVRSGYTDIVEILLKNRAYVNVNDLGNAAFLHLAAGRGHKDIVNALITKGVDVDATYSNLTPLCFAAQEGYEEVVEILIARGANFNFISDEHVTPLHLATTSGHGNVVKVLLDNKANINVKNNENRTPLELAVAHGHLEVVKMLLLQDYKKIDINAKGNDDWTILHIASQRNNLEIIKYLVDKGSNVNATTAFGLKPIHIAAVEGCKDTVEFFFSKGLSINELDAANKTLLHYAALKGHLEVAKYLITQGADINAKDTDGLTPMHIAANCGYKDVIEVLLKNGAVYNAVGKFHIIPLQISKDKNVFNLLESTKKLFEAVKRNGSSDVENYIKAGAVVNAKNVNGTSLHYAAWKGYDSIVNILLQNKADPNAVDKKGFTPLHYAAKFCRLKVVKLLLSNGAVYNAVSDGKTPSDFTVDESITRLFQLLRDSFKNIKNNDSRVINDLNKIKDIDTVKSIMNARNEENKTLVVSAVHNNFSEVEQLKEVSQDGVSAQINLGLMFYNRGDYRTALCIFESVFEKRKEILGSDNPGTLDIQTYIGDVSYAQGAYQEALNTFKKIFQKQKQMLGLNDKSTLSTRSKIALVLHRQGRNKEAFNIYQEVCQKQDEILGTNHLDTLDSQFHMALVLDAQRKYEEALNIHRTVFEKRKTILSADDPSVLCIQKNIAVVLANQGELEKALTIYKDVYERKKKVLGIDHDEKKNGKSRLFIDFRRVNEVTKIDAYLSLRIFATLDKLLETSCLSMLNLKNGYWQVPLSPKSRKITAFIMLSKSLMQFTFQLNTVLGPELELNVFVCLGIIVSQTFDKYLCENIRIDLRRSVPSPTVPFHKMYGKYDSFLGGVVPWYCYDLLKDSPSLPPHLSHLHNNKPQMNLGNRRINCVQSTSKQTLTDADVSQLQAAVHSTDRCPTGLMAVLTQYIPEGERMIANRTLNKSKRNYLDWSIWPSPSSGA